MAPAELAPLPRAARSQSISSDRPSLTGYGGLTSPPLLITPDPAFIAASAASQIVTNDHDSHAESWLDQHGIEPSGETALVAPPALRLVNRFLDQLLFNFLAVSKATTLTALRPAVSEVLKPKLAKDAINGADQELNEYLGGGDDETVMAYHNGLEANGDWDLELIWKRTRLRCMVYSSLGDMEEEDEDFYTEREHLEVSASANSEFASSSGVVSPAVAIFLTSILEFVGEQVLVVAGQAAYQRLKSKYEKEAKEGTQRDTDIADRVVVEDTDMERVALDRTLGRLWRGWKKRVRSPNNSISMSRSFSGDSLEAQLRSDSVAGEEASDEVTRRPSLAAVLAEFEMAANIPLPINANDIREIEIPGLAAQSDDSEAETLSSEEEAPRPRPKSMAFYDRRNRFSLTPSSPQSLITPTKSRKRSNSLPTPGPSPYTPSKRQKQEADTSEKEVKDPKVQDKATEEELDSGVETKSKTVEAEERQGKNEGLIAGAVAGIAAAAAVGGAGVVALVKGQAPQTDLESRSEVDPEEEFTGEPEVAQILTSSRVSIGGDHVSPDDLKELSRRSSIRSHSVHSVRVIEVTKSPGLSRAPSDSGDRLGRPSIGSRPNSTQSGPDFQSPLVASPVSRGQNASPLRKIPSSSSHTSHARNSAAESISEEKEVYESDAEVMTAVPAELAAAMQGVDVDPSPTSQHFSSEEPSRETTPQPAPFVLAAAPPARHPRHIAKGKSPTIEQQANTSGRLATVSRSPVNENGAPPLTPLREMMEVAPDTSDEASSMAPSYDTHSISENGTRADSPSASVSTQRPGDQKRPLRSINTNISQTTPTPRPGRDEPIRKVSDYARTPKSTRTSGSNSDSASQKYVATRTSEEDSVNGGKAQSFDQLIRSDQTIQYTLTPENMRNIEALDSPNATSSIKAHDVPRPVVGRSRSSSTGKFVQNGLRSNPPEAGTPNPSFQPASRPPPAIASGSRLRKNVPQARDARVDRDSIGDFAEFIRSTGPANSYGEAPPRTVQAHRGTNGTARNFSGSIPRTSSPASVPRRANSSAGRQKLQARDAVVPRGDSISDLIDFVRSGPQVEQNGGHRISRSVAPFRSTMDSDQMVGAVGGKAIDATFHDARYSVASNSVQSSVNSTSGLLKNAAVNKPRPAQRNEFDEEDMIPKRKTRRVKDPYAIDSSDEEDNFEPSSRVKPIKEESLADFLKNVPPPPSPPTTSVFDSVPKPPSKDIKKKSSTPSLMSRFGRNNSAPAVQKPKTPSGYDSRSNGSRNGFVSHTPITAKYNTANTLGPAQGNNYPSQSDPARSRVPRKTYQPRDAVLSSTNRTNDLADFLMRSEPPSSVQTQPQTFAPIMPPKEEGGAFSRMFGRKKVH